ncbi:MAG TPA: hypothetical protein VJ508_11150, partial [Saprospiraceae bacterium]|nr:hypothetical protein [Saprospiraceae bacterium]
MSTRILILFFILLLIDLLAFQAVRQIFSGYDKTWRTLIYLAYWLVPILSMGYIMTAMTGWNDQFPKGVQEILRALIFILYFTKLLMAVVILVDDL